MNYHIKASVWTKLYKYLKQIKGIHTANEYKTRKLIEAIWYISRTGCQWRLLPDTYGAWRSLHKRFKYWSNKDLWRNIMNLISDIDNETMMIDSTICRAHCCASGYIKGGNNSQALGRSKGGFTCKLHAMVDALGNPIKFILTSGQASDYTEAINLTCHIESTHLLADKDYDSDQFIEHLENKNCIAVIPPRKNRIHSREYDEHLYKERHLIECFFNKIKHFRRIFSRFDKTAVAYLGFIYFVGILIWLK